MRTLVVGMVGIEPAGDGLVHELQRHPPRFGLERLEVIEHARADQPLGFVGELAAELRLDRRDETFAVTALSWMSHIWALTSNSARASKLVLDVVASAAEVG